MFCTHFQMKKQISQKRYSFTSTGKATLISVQVSSFHSRDLRMKLSKVLRFYQITFAQEYRTLMQSTEWNMAPLGKIYPYYTTEVVNYITVRCSWSGKLLSVLDEMLERLKFAILFIIVDIWLVKNKSKKIKNLSTENSFTLVWTIHLVKKRYCFCELQHSDLGDCML